MTLFSALCFSFFLCTIGAVRKNHQAEKAMDMEINQHAIRWFNLASDRGGGRRQRSQTTPQWLIYMSSFWTAWHWSASGPFPIVIFPFGNSDSCLVFSLVSLFTYSYVIVIMSDLITWSEVRADHVILEWSESGEIHLILSYFALGDQTSSFTRTCLSESQTCLHRAESGAAPLSDRQSTTAAPAEHHIYAVNTLHRESDVCLFDLWRGGLGGGRCWDSAGTPSLSGVGELPHRASSRAYGPWEQPHGVRGGAWQSPWGCRALCAAPRHSPGCCGPDGWIHGTGT